MQQHHLVAMPKEPLDFSQSASFRSDDAKVGSVIQGSVRYGHRPNRAKVFPVARPNARRRPLGFGDGDVDVVSLLGDEGDAEVAAKNAVAVAAPDIGIHRASG